MISGAMRGPIRATHRRHRHGAARGGIEGARRLILKTPYRMDTVSNKRARSEMT